MCLASWRYTLHVDPLGSSWHYLGSLTHTTTCKSLSAPCLDRTLRLASLLHRIGRFFEQLVVKEGTDVVRCCCIPPPCTRRDARGRAGAVDEARGPEGETNAWWAEVVPICVAPVQHIRASVAPPADQEKMRAAMSVRTKKIYLNIFSLLVLGEVNYHWHSVLPCS